MGCGSSRDPPLSIDDETEDEKPDLSEEEINSENIEITQENSPEQTKLDYIIPSPTKENGITRLEPLKPKQEEDQAGELIMTRPISNSSSKKGEASVSFEVVVDESLIRKHPPKKFQKLEDIQTEPSTLTPEELEMKQEIARQRRQTLLSKRVQSAKERSAKSAHIRSNTEDNHDENAGAIESPEDM